MSALTDSRSTFTKSDAAYFLLPLAAGCSLVLCIITLAAPLIPGDWARLDKFGIYIPQNLGYKWSPYWIQVGFWLTMVAALLVAARFVSAGDLTPTISKPRTQYIPNQNRFIANRAALVGIILLGFILRLHTLTQLPLIVDEIGFAAHASDILHGQFVPILAPGHNANPSVFSWLVALSMSIFGQNTFGIRLVPFLFGTLSIPAAYLMGREWHSKRVGLLAALFLATFPAHVFYSRLCMYGIVDPFFDLLALAFLVRAVRRSRVTDAVLAGLYAGIAQYFYHGSRLLLVLVALYVLVALINHLSSSGTKPKFPYGWLIASFIIVSLPRFAPMFLDNLPVTGNMEVMRLPNDMPQNTLRAFLAWVGQPDVSPFWLSNQPLLLWPALLAFLLGIVLCLRRWRDPRSLVLLVSLPLTSIFGAAIWTSAPLYVRYIAALPTIVLLVALGLDWLLFSPAFKRSRFALPYIGVVLTFTLCAYGCYASAISHPQQALSRIVPGQWESDALARQAAELPTGMAAALIVRPDFTAPSPDPRVMQIIGIAHYIAAYGERRPLIVHQDGGTRLTTQVARLNRPYTLLRVSSE